jgi:hypothetical protein
LLKELEEEVLSTNLIVEYKIVNCEDISEIEKEVNNLISLGWVPQGGICIVNTAWQAMVLYADAKRRQEKQKAAIKMMDQIMMKQI